MKKPDFNIAKNRENVDIIYTNLNEDYNPIVSDKKYFIRTYGCQMNTHDSEQIKSYLEILGYTQTEVLDDADVVVLNTCAIRENAKDKLFGFLSRAKHLKETLKPDLIIVLAGCLMQLEGEIDALNNKHKYVDIVIGTHNIDDLPNFIINKNETQNITVYSNSDLVKDNIKYERDSKVTAFVNITYGCNNFCTYCIVPFTRGRERSRKKEEILDEVVKLKENGYKEVTLLGQNVNSYNDEGIKFYELLELVAKTGIERVRFITSNPWNFSDELIKIVKKYDNVMSYIHLPVQSGSSAVLKLMNRKYTKEEYITLFDKIKNEVPNVAISTDIIVGFPGETEEDFNETLAVADYCKFDSAFTFIYSKREGTIAEKFEDNVSKEEKNNRLYKLNEKINEYALMNNEAQLGKTLNLLVLGISDKDAAKVYGYSESMKVIKVTGSKELIGQIVPVKITAANTFGLDGELII